MQQQAQSVVEKINAIFTTPVLLAIITVLLGLIGMQMMNI
jgi:hypothetical protein